MAPNDGDRKANSADPDEIATLVLRIGSLSLNHSTTRKTTGIHLTSILSNYRPLRDIFVSELVCVLGVTDMDGIDSQRCYNI